MTFNVIVTTESGEVLEAEEDVVFADLISTATAVARFACDIARARREQGDVEYADCWD